MFFWFGDHTLTVVPTETILFLIGCISILPSTTGPISSKIYFYHSFVAILSNGNCYVCVRVAAVYKRNTPVPTPESPFLRRLWFFAIYKKMDDRFELDFIPVLCYNICHPLV